MLVGVDPGHGGDDAGGNKRPFIEKDMNLYVALKVKKLLQGKVEVFMTRDTDVTVSLTERSKMFNNAKTDFNISIHHNANDGKAKGFEVYHYTGSKLGKKFAEIVGAEFAISRPKRFIGCGMMVGTVPGDYWMLRATNAMTILTEYGFLDNPTEQKEMNLDSEAFSIATGILKYANLYVEPDEDLLKRLVSKGIINSPDYWATVLKSGTVNPEYLRALLQSVLRIK